MAVEKPSPAETTERPGRTRPVLMAATLGPALLLLGVLAYYFAAREESDWVLVAAYVLSAAAVAIRLAGAFRSKKPS